ncbi:MAG: energy transducer TonB [Candidatus Acidiferrales bacterium]
MTEIPEQNGGSSPAAVPVKDRRLHPRQRVSSLTYVDLGEDNGGIVLNVSEAGIRIQAAAGLEEGPISIRLQLPGTRKRLEVNAEVVWVGQSRKEAGLRFVDLSEDAQRQIQKWMAREASPGGAIEEEEIENVAEPARAEQVSAEEVPAGAAAAALQEPALRDERGFDDDYTTEDDPILNADDTTEEAVEEEPAEAAEDDLAASDAEDEAEDISQAKPAPIEAPAPLAARVSEPEAPKVQIPEVRKTPEPQRAIVEAPVPVPAKTDELPVSVFNGISGTHGAPSMAMSSSARIAPRPSPAGGDAPLFVRPHRPAQTQDEDGSKSYRVKLQSGWFLAALVFLLALISFIAGMAVRRGALNGVIGQSDEPVHPQSAPPLTAAALPGTASAGVSSGETAEATAKPLEIEILDSSGRRWEIPGASGTNHADASAEHSSPPSEAALPAANDAAAARKPAEPPRGSQDASSAAASADKSSAPLMLTLPETPISASGSVAIRSRGEVPVPPGAAKSAQQGRNLQIGQLTNLVEPVYPPDALEHRVEGTVKLHAVIGVDGAIKSLEPRSGPELLIQAAMTAVREWKYNPTTLNGKPIETQEDVSFVFRLPK